jgi:hypothetical protein
VTLGAVCIRDDGEHTRLYKIGVLKATAGDAIVDTHTYHH